MNLAAALRQSAHRRPDHPALLDGESVVSHAALDRAVDLVAAGLTAVGIASGDRVGLLAANGPAFVATLYGTWRVGAVAVPLDAGATAEEARHVLDDSGASAVVVDAAHRPLITTLEDALADLAQVLDADDAAWATLAGDTPVPEEHTGDGLALLAYTAGTTGKPHGAMLRHAHLAANHDQLGATQQQVLEDDVVLGVLPMSHIYGLNVALCYPLSRGATVCCLPAFEPDGSLEAIARHQVTVVPAVPAMYVAWLEVGPRADFSSVRVAASGAAPLAASTAAAFTETFGVPIWEGYGLTETAPVLTTTAMGSEPRPGSVGRPLPGVELRLVGDRGQPVAAGDPGEVLARGPNVFDGYWQDRTTTERLFTADGFFRTRDIGYADADGELHLVDRKSDLIIVNGFNVYPREVEDVLNDHPGVAQAAVVGRPDDRSGEAVKAVVVAYERASVSEDDLFRYCRRFLARFKCPVEIEFADELPTLSTGKILRRELR